MDKIRYVVVCKKGYAFVCSLDEVEEFILKHGKDIAYYVGQYMPISEFDYLRCVNKKLEDLGN